MPNAKHIAAEWSQYVERVLPPNAGAMQVQETRRAFYAGAGCILHRLLRLVDDSDEPTADDLTLMFDIDAELTEWLSNVTAGRRCWGLRRGSGGLGLSGVLSSAPTAARL